MLIIMNKTYQGRRGHKGSHNDLTQERVRDLFEYNTSTGNLSWRISMPPRGRVGAIAGFMDDQKRIKIGINGQEYFAHRIIWLWMNGAWPTYEVDHINEIKSDNSWTNLREATSSQNHRNRGRPRNNKTGYKGVCFDNTRKKYIATINVLVNGKKKQFWLGAHSTPEAAYEAYKAGAKKIHGEKWAKF